jgi:quercetin dioxygenase-like cupin family protein
MKRLMLAVLVIAAIDFVVAATNKKEIAAITPSQVRWFTPPYYTDGRQRAHLLGDSNQEGAWIDRAKIPAGKRVLAHTHPQDEPVTVIEGTWYLGEGAKFDTAKLKAYPAGSFILIPAGIPHFVAATEGDVIIQLSGNRKFQTDYVEQ